jgi:serine/threonine protein kinase/Flp pilus assembly protein TadD
VTEEKWKQIRQIVNAAIDIPLAERPGYLDEACFGSPEIREEVDSLLAMEEPAKHFIETPVVAREEEEQDLPSFGEEECKRIGQYEIIHEIGRGGMARVYEALRDDEFRMRVAIKVVQPRFLNREEVDWRFRHERRILASLDHPNIAKILDGGTTEEGLLYFVMEFVEGEQLDEYCDSRNLNTAERVRIFRKVCSAVEYAHRKLVVHRDLKPSNIMVTTDGEPKLLDFGIAKLLEPEIGSLGETTAPVTVPGLQPMTPGFASPEQFKGETITVATDVYSLGVVFYELLTGHNPHRIRNPVYEQFRQSAIKKEPTKPSEIVGQSEVVWTSRERAAELTPEGVSRTRQKTLKELKRHLTGDLDCIVLKTLRKDPEQRYTSIREFSEDLGFFLQGRPVVARRGEFSYQVLKLMKLHQGKVAFVGLLVIVLASLIYHSWKVHKFQERDRAIVSLVTAIAGDRREGSFNDKLQELTSGEMRDVLEKVNNLANVMEENQGDYQTAEGIYRTVLDLKREKLGTDDPSIAVGWSNLAANLTIQGKYQEAESLYQKALALKEKIYGHKSKDVIRVMNNLTVFYQNTGQLDRADATLLEIYAIRDEVLNPDEPLYLVGTNNYGFSLHLRKKFVEAEEVYREVLEKVRLWKKPLRDAGILRNLAEVLRGQGKLAEAEKVARQAHRLAYGALVDAKVGDIESVLGACLMDLGRVEEAGPLLLRGYEATGRGLGENARQTVEARKRLEAWREATGG